MYGIQLIKLQNKAVANHDWYLSRMEVTSDPFIKISMACLIIACESTLSEKTGSIVIREDRLSMAEGQHDGYPKLMPYK